MPVTLVLRTLFNLPLLFTVSLWLPGRLVSSLEISYGARDYKTMESRKLTLELLVPDIVLSHTLAARSYTMLL